MPVQSGSAAHMFPKTLYKHLLPALLAGLALRLYFIWRFPFYSGDTRYYEELARNWLYHGIYGFYSHGQLLPSEARAPGYPAFLAGIYFLAATGRKAVMLAQAFLDLVTCVFAAGISSRLAVGASDRARGRVAAAALWLTALCPFTANYAAVPLTEVLATFFTTLALLVFLSPAGMEFDRIASNSDLLRATKTWFAGGLVVGIGTLVRPETPLLLFAVVLALWFRYRGPTNWKRLTVATLWMIAGLLLPLAPWAGRNAVSLGRAQFLAPRYAETYGDVLPTGFYAWTKTWMFRFRDSPRSNASARGAIRFALIFGFPSSGPPRCGSLHASRCCLFPDASGRSPKVTTTIPPSSKLLSGSRCSIFCMWAWPWRPHGFSAQILESC